MYMIGTVCDFEWCISLYIYVRMYMIAGVHDWKSAYMYVSINNCRCTCGQMV